MEVVQRVNIYLQNHKTQTECTACSHLYCVSRLIDLNKNQFIFEKNKYTHQFPEVTIENELRGIGVNLVLTDLVRNERTRKNLE